MNINNIEEPKEIPENIWKAIFDKQWELAIKYKDIEGMGDLLETLESNIDTKKGQRWIKDFAWRVTEELTEADEAINQLKNYPLSEENKQKILELNQHYVEEITDALHFFVEMALICGYRETDFLENPLSGISNQSYNVIYNLGLMCNCLKNKPWKQTQMLTDRTKFKKYLDAAWASLIGLYYNMELNNQDIYTFYFKKNQVNQFRIRSKY